MSYYDDEDDYKASVKATGFFLKIAFNIAILIILFKFLYYPGFPEILRNSEYLYIMPTIGIIGTYFYLSYWFGRKTSICITGLVALSILIVVFTSADTLLNIYALAIISFLGYGIYLLAKSIVGKR